MSEHIDLSTILNHEFLIFFLTCLIKFLRLQFPAVKASDRDLGPNAQMTFTLEGPYSDWFDIDRVTSAITMNAKGSLQVDRETTPVFTVDVSYNNIILFLPFFFV